MPLEELTVYRTELPLVSQGTAPLPEGEGQEPWLTYFGTLIAAKRSAGYATKVQVTIALDVCQAMMGEAAPPYYEGDQPANALTCGADKDFLKVWMDGALPSGRVIVE